LLSHHADLRKSKHIQTFVSSAFNDVVNKFNCISELPRRLALWFPHEHLSQELLAKIPAMFTCRVRASPYVRMCVLKSFLHAWTTSHRAHEHTLLTCIFGCANAPDAMKHYFCCERFWSIGSVSHISPPLLLGLDQPSPHSFLTLAIAFHYFHACRGQPSFLFHSLLDASVRAIHLAF
jgi:hypothetical protein